MRKDRFCFSRVGHQDWHSRSRMENTTGKAHPKNDISISCAEGCWLNLAPSPPWLVPGDVLAMQWPSRKASAPLASSPL